MTSNNIAKYEYSSGNLLLLPKEGKAPLLFLEFIRDYSKEIGRTIVVQMKEDKTILTNSFFRIRLANLTRESYAEAIHYINSNL